MKLEEIQKFIESIFKNNVSEIKIETNDFKVVIKTHPNIKQNVSSIVPETTVTPPPSNLSVSSILQENKISEIKNDVYNDKNYHVIKSPMIGTFYRSSAPDRPPFVNIGDIVDVGQPLCIIEAMKLFNEIESDVKGRVVKILVENATPVEYDQPLILIETIDDGK